MNIKAEKTSNFFMTWNWTEIRLNLIYTVEKQSGWGEKGQDDLDQSRECYSTTRLEIRLNIFKVLFGKLPLILCNALGIHRHTHFVQLLQYTQAAGLHRNDSSTDGCLHFPSFCYC